MKSIFLVTLLTISSLHAEVRGWWDIAPREYPELEFIYREVPDENNGLKEIAQLMEKLSENEEHKLWPNLQNKHKGVKRSETLINLHNQTIEHLKSLLKKDLQSEGEINLAASYSNEMLMMKAADFLANQALLKSAENDSIKAIEIFDQLYILSHKMIHTDGGLVNYLVGCACYTRSFNTAIELTSTQSFKTPALNKLAKILSQPVDTQPRFRNALNFEFAAFKQTVLDLYFGRLHQLGAPSLTFKPKFLADFFVRLGTRTFLQPNSTIDLLAQDVREAKKDQNLAPRQRKHPVRKPKLLQIFSANLIGLSLLDAAGPAWNKSQSANIQVQHDLTRLYIALSLYVKEQKQLPETLDDLTPNYIKVLPLDPYSNKAFLYSKEKKLLWSIGDDFKDNQGISRQKKRNKRNRSKSKNTIGATDEPHIVIPF